jgi:hypothetical protein
MFLREHFSYNFVHTIVTIGISQTERMGYEEQEK